jgi:hypothetical protein
VEWFKEAARLRPNDAAAAVMIARARQLAADASPLTSWDGIYHATQK